MTIVWIDRWFSNGTYGSYPRLFQLKQGCAFADDLGDLNFKVLMKGN